MKKSAEIRGLPVICLADGTRLGIVKELLIDPSVKEAAALVVDDGRWYLGARILPFTAVVSIGDSAVTVFARESVVDLSAAPEFIALFEAGVTVAGSSLLSQSGRTEGVVREFAVDARGRISFCEAQGPDGQLTRISAARISAFGRDVTILNGEPETPSRRQHQTSFPAPVLAASPPKSAPAHPPSPSPERNGDDRHRKFLAGKKAARRIAADSGVVIVEQGGEITEEVIQKARLAGKFLELSMNIQ